MAETGVISLLTVIYVFGIIFRNIYRRRKLCANWKIFEEPTDLLLTSLFAIDAIQSIGAIFNIVWLHEGKVEVGTWCESQGIFKQFGEVGVALSTMLIAVYTFVALWVGRQIRSMRLTAALVALTWIFPAILVVLGHVTTKGHFHGPVPMWCWITKAHPTWRIMGEYLWMWIALAFCLLMYVPIYFWNRGNLVPHDTTWWKFSVRSAKRARIDSELKKKAFVMLLYPIAYAIVVLPLSIVRWITFAQEKYHTKVSMPIGATILAMILFASSGALNVILYIRTRPDTALFRSHYRDDRDTTASPGSHRLAKWKTSQGGLATSIIDGETASDSGPSKPTFEDMYNSGPSRVPTLEDMYTYRGRPMYQY